MKFKRKSAQKMDVSSIEEYRRIARMCGKQQVDVIVTTLKLAENAEHLVCVGVCE